MPSLETLERFIAVVEQNRHDVAIEEFYLEHSTMRENQATPRAGRHNHVENERRVLARVRTMQSACVRPVFVSGDHVAIRWRFRFDFLDDTFIAMEEVTCQRWEGERIAEETFFYDPAQRVPRRVDAAPQ